MNPFEMVLGIVIIACCAGVVNNWVNARGKHKKVSEEVPAVDQAELDRLEKRIQVLEKIVTDRNYELKRELHEL